MNWCPYEISTDVRWGFSHYTGRLFVYLLLTFYYYHYFKDKVTERKGETKKQQLFHLLVHCLNIHKWGWARLNSKANNFIHWTHMGEKCQNTWVTICCLLRQIIRELDWKRSIWDTAGSLTWNANSTWCAIVLAPYIPSLWMSIFPGPNGIYFDPSLS